MVHVTDMKKITLMEQVADEYEQLGKEGRFSKKCIPRGYIPDFDWTKIHQDQDQPIKPIKHEDPTEDTTTPAAPTEVEGPPSSHLRSKTKQQSKHYSLMRWAKLLLYTKRITKHPAPVAKRCTVAVAMAAYNLKCKQTTVKTVQ